MESLFDHAARCLDAQLPDEKLFRTWETVKAWRAARLTRAHAVAPPQPIGPPGRPERPVLVVPRELPRRGFHTSEARAALMHAITHIEFNAINLAWDVIYRFRDMPSPFYDDWIKVAHEEAYHFALLRDRLTQLGYCYGDFSAHNGLWEMAQDTAHDVLARMALVPRVLEARGLDVTPGMIARLQDAGDRESAACLENILRDEVGHVQIGSRWFRWLCDQRGLESEKTFHDLIVRYMKVPLRGPFRRDTRLRAGFSVQELDKLEELARV